MLFPFQILFSFGVIFGTLIAVSSTSWFTAWMGLELNLISFLPIIFKESKMGSNESGLKYFFIQAVASLLILVGSLFPLYLNSFGVSLISLSLFMKMGVAPLHFWLPPIIEGLSWFSCLILLTWQKLAPLWLISEFDPIFIIPLISVLIGSLGGFNQSSLKKILAYSSIMHMGWMMSGVMLSLSLGMKYFGVYLFFSLFLVLMFAEKNILELNQLMVSDSFISISILLLMLSMGGLPPFLGFFPKWYVITELLSQNVLLSLFLIFSSLINLFFYFRLFYTGMFLEGLSSKVLIFKKSEEKKLFFAVFFSSFGGIFYPLLFM
uniref:NADH dehydrogenase subunit 2 n=1 Tax=Lychas mucronatus TaxID=172552 RepID=UPI0023D7FF4B|nr:NADH dehydrogenase subunit 2 [Lychas mucronatus]WDA95770.1 NADH dehydrogenase subunit 2 [Lychas mucronatus]